MVTASALIAGGAQWASVDDNRRRPFPPGLHHTDLHPLKSNQWLLTAGARGRNERAVDQVAGDDAGAAELRLAPRVEVLQRAVPALVDEPLAREVVDERVPGLAGVHQRQRGRSGGERARLEA